MGDALHLFGPGGRASRSPPRDWSVERLGLIRAPEDRTEPCSRAQDRWRVHPLPSAGSGPHSAALTSGCHDRRICTVGRLPKTYSRRASGWWDSARIGMSPPPLETPERLAGGLPRRSGDSRRRSVPGRSVALLDLEDPAKVQALRGWVLGPREGNYELVGDVPGVVFPCGSSTTRRRMSCGSTTVPPTAASDWPRPPVGGAAVRCRPRETGDSM